MWQSKVWSEDFWVSQLETVTNQENKCTLSVLEVETAEVQRQNRMLNGRTMQE